LKNRKISLILALLLLVFTFPSCRDTLPRDYREYAFFAEIRYEYGGDTFCAEVNVGVPSNAEQTRDIELRFTAPPTLAGLCVSQKSGIQRVTLGSADIKREAAAKGFLRAANLLIPDGSMEFIERFEENGLLFYKAEISSADRSISLSLDSNGNPKRVSCDDITVTVIRFE